MSNLNNIILNKYGANCVGYWPLNGNTNDLKGGNHLSGGTAGTYVNGPDGEKAMLFNGTSNSISSASAIDLTGTNKVTFFVFWYPNTYPTTGSGTIGEFSANVDSATDGFLLSANGALANDPMLSYLKGDVGVSYGGYNSSNFSSPKWYSLAAVYDKSLTTGEAELYINGVLATKNSAGNQNNTNSFGNNTLFIGSRNNAAAFFNCTISKIALFNTVLTSNQIKEIHSQMNPGYSILNWMSYFEDSEIKRGYRYGD